MVKILYLSNHSPDPDRGGGFHRTYQIAEDLRRLVGEATINMPSIGGLKNKKLFRIKDVINSVVLRTQLSSLIWKLNFDPSKIYNYLIQTNKTGLSLFKMASLDAYKAYLDADGKPDICIVDGAKFLPVIQFNKENHIPTIFCPHNLDSFDLSAPLADTARARIRCSTSFIYELEAITQSDSTLVISKFEQSILDGLGVGTDYYPYLPVGLIKKRLLDVREERAKHDKASSSFLLIGSMNHKTTFESFKWFMRNISEHGLPSGMRIRVAGRGCDTLQDQFPKLQGVEYLGQLNQRDLEQELINTRAVLIPQLSGFGAVTRISEMACAGIPVFVSQHPTRR